MSLDALLDNFNRANENPLSDGGNWSISGTFVAPFQLSSNGAIATSGAKIDQSSFAAAGSLTNCDVAATVVTLPTAGNYIGVVARQNTSTNTGKNLYQCIYIAGTGVEVDWVDGTGVVHTLATYSQTLSAGDLIGLRVYGTTLTAYYKPSAGSWTALGSSTDSNLTGGYIGVTGFPLIGGGKLDDFAGGSVVPSGFGIAGLIGAGASDSSSPQTFVKAGDSIAGLVARGASASIFQEAGTGSAGTGDSGSDFIVTAGRVLIAWDDGPLEPNPAWTSIDQAANGFPDQFVAGYDIKVGRQTLLSQTDTGTATVYINDHELGLFDDRNMSSPYQGILSGRQIMLQLWNPVTDVWEPQFRGLIDDYSYDIDGSATDANNDPINASIQLQCVDMFDYLNGFGLTPGLAGVTPPAGAEDGVYYAATAGTMDDRIIEILTDAGVDPDMYGSPGLASGNVKIMAAKYDPGESALTAIRDAVDAEFPFIGVCYCDRYGKFQFRGRYGRFEPDAVSSEPGSEWDFTRWAVGDEKAILADPTRAQMRVLSFSRSRAELINVAMSWTQNLPAAEMPNQVFADTSSITAFGQHAAPPMSDLLTAEYAGPGTITPDDGKTQCFLYAKLLVKNKAFPREAITALQAKAIDPNDYRAAATWAFITRSDLSHIVNVRVGYPGGTGFEGTSPTDDYYIEGRSLLVRPLNPIHDYVEYNLEVSPAVWSMDTHSVFPTHDGASPADALAADFSYAQ